MNPEKIDVNPFMTEPEMISVIKERALMLERGSTPLVEIPVDVGHGTKSWDPVDIAAAEIFQKKISITFKRNVPSGIVVLESKDMILLPI